MSDRVVVRNVGSGGIGAGTVLFIVMLTLKLAMPQSGIEWWMVIGSLFLPMLIGFGILAVIAVVGGTALAFGWVLDKVANR